MKVAILGWGSLIWDTRDLRLASDWMEGGPSLPIEFSRISDNGRLTLVIDERDGVDVTTRYARSSSDDLDEAITNLQKREGAPVRDRIGFFDVARGLTSARAWAQHPIACERIRTWTEDHRFDGVVWTAIGPRFEEKRGVSFSVDAAIEYLAALKRADEDMSPGLHTTGAGIRGDACADQNIRHIWFTRALMSPQGWA